MVIAAIITTGVRAKRENCSGYNIILLSCPHNISYDMLVKCVIKMIFIYIHIIKQNNHHVAHTYI